MSTHVFRTFLYLDEQALEDFLAGAGIPGVRDEKVVQTDSTTTSGGGELDLKVAKGKGEREALGSLEVTRQSIITPAVRFQQLYSLLEDDNPHWYYEGLDDGTWASIGRNSVLELAVDIALTQIGTLSASLSDFAALAKIAEGATGQSFLDDSAKASMRGFEQLAELEAKRGVPVKMTLIATPQYTFAAYLNPTFLRVSKQELTGEVSAVVKIQRKLSKGEEYRFFNLGEFVDNFGSNRQQRRQQGRSKQPELPEMLRDGITGPGAIITPVAIYR